MVCGLNIKYGEIKVTQLTDKAKKKYYENMVKNSKDPRCLWKCIHSLNPSNHVKPYELTEGDDISTQDVTKMTNIFNEFFTTCVQNLRDT